MDSANVLVGSGKMYVADAAVAMPAMTGAVIDWSTWKSSGYTEDGVEFQYTPTYKDVDVDEELAPVDEVLTGEQFVVNAKLAEATLDNLCRAISASTLATVVADATKIGSKTLKFGSGKKKVPFQIAFEGKSPEGFWRVIQIFKATSVSAVSMGYKKGEKTVFQVQFKALADSSKPEGERLCAIVDMTAIKTA